VTATLARPTAVPAAAMVPVDTVRFHPRNIRADLGDLRELTASITAEGVLQPLLLHRRDTRLLEVVDGHRRLASARLAGLRRVPALIVAELDDDEAITKMLATTLRQGISPEERRRALLTLHHEFGHTVTALAARYGVCGDTIRRWMADEPSGRTSVTRRRIPVERVESLADSWRERAEQGLSPDQACALLAEIRALCPPLRPSIRETT